MLAVCMYNTLIVCPAKHKYVLAYVWELEYKSFAIKCIIVVLN